MFPKGNEPSAHNPKFEKDRKQVLSLDLSIKTPRNMFKFYLLV